MVFGDALVGRIQIDTSALDKARQNVQQSGDQMAGAMDKFSLSIAKAEKQLEKLQLLQQRSQMNLQKLQKREVGGNTPLERYRAAQEKVLRIQQEQNRMQVRALSIDQKRLQIAEKISRARERETSALDRGMAAAGATGVGYGLAQGFGIANRYEQTQVSIAAMYPEDGNVNEYLQRVRDLANEYREPILDVMSAAKDFLPQIRSQSIDMEKLFLATQQLTKLDPMQGLRGAMQSIKELLSGDEESLIRRFEFPATREQIAAIYRENEGNANDVISGMSNFLAEIGLSEESIKAAGQEGTNAFKRFNQQAQELVAVGMKPLLDILQDLAEAGAQLMGELNKHPVLVKFLGTVTALTAAAAGLKLALFAFDAALMRSVATMLLGGRAAGVMRAGGALAMGAGAVAGGVMLGSSMASHMGAGGPAQSVARMMGANVSDDQLDQYNKELQENAVGKFFEVVGQGFVILIKHVVKFNMYFVKAFRDFFRLGSKSFAEIDKMANDAAVDVAKALGLVQETGDAIKGGAEEQKKFADEQIAAFRKFQESIKDTQEEFEEKREELVEKYEAQRTDTIAESALRRNEMIRDFERQQRLDREKLNRDIAKMRDDLAEDEADVLAMRSERIIEAQEDAQEQERELREDHYRRMQEMERKYALDIEQAAASLDARQVYQLQQQRELEREQQQKSFQERLQNIRDGLNKIIIEERERINDRKEALAEEIEAMREAMEERHRLQADDLAYQFQKMDEQLDRELAKMEDAHRERMRELEEQEQEKLHELEQNFRKEWNQLESSEEKKLRVQEMSQEESLRMLESYWSRFQDAMQHGLDGAMPEGGGGGAGRSADTDSGGSGRSGGRASSEFVFARTPGRNNAPAVNVGDIQIALPNTDGMSRQQMAQVVAEEVPRQLQEFFTP